MTTKEFQRTTQIYIYGSTNSVLKLELQTSSCLLHVQAPRRLCLLCERASDSLLLSGPDVVSIDPPAVCTHPLPSQRLIIFLSAGERDNMPYGATVRISLQLSITVSFFPAVCAFPDRCLHRSSRCLHTPSPLSASQSPSHAHLHRALSTDTVH